MPTRPLWLGTCLISQSIVSNVSVLSSMSVRAGLLRPVRPHVDELALRHPAAAHILVDDDVAVLAEERRRAEVRLVGVDAVGLHAVGRAA